MHIIGVAPILDIQQILLRIISDRTDIHREGCTFGQLFRVGIPGKELGSSVRILHNALQRSCVSIYRYGAAFCNLGIQSGSGSNDAFASAYGSHRSGFIHSRHPGIRG